MNGSAHGLSRNAPSAASCRPPETGCSSESKVVGLVMRLTERALTSCAERKPNSTPWMAEEMGWEVFMVAPACEPAVVSFTCAGAAMRDFSDQTKQRLHMQLQKIASKKCGPTPLACTRQERCLRLQQHSVTRAEHRIPSCDTLHRRRSRLPRVHRTFPTTPTPRYHETWVAEQPSPRRLFNTTTPENSANSQHQQHHLQDGREASRR